MRGAARAGLADRVSFEVQDAADPKLAGRYDLVTIFEALHDMGRPVEALRAARALLADEGSLVIMDERVADTFTAPGGEVEQLMYGCRILHCLPVGLADHEQSAATGTVFRTDILRRYAAEAGFPDVEVLPIENDFWALLPPAVVAAAPPERRPSASAPAGTDMGLARAEETAVDWDDDAGNPGATSGRAAGLRDAEITHPDDIDANLTLTQELAAGRRSSYQLTKRYVRKTGETMWALVTAAMTRGGSGSARYLIAQLQDVTEQLRSETELRQERDFVTTLLQTQANLVVTLDRDGRFTRFNRAAEKFTGYTFEEVRGQHFSELFIEPSERERVKGVLDRVWAGDFPNDNENHWIHRDGTKRLMAFKNTAMLDEDGEVEYIVSSALDITERQRAQDAIRERDARLRLALDAALMGSFEFNPRTEETIVETSERLGAPLGARARAGADAVGRAEGAHAP